MDTVPLLDLKPIVNAFLLGLFVWTATGCLIFGALLIRVLYETIKTLFHLVYSICDFMRFVLTAQLFFMVMAYYEIHSMLYDNREVLKVEPKDETPVPKVSSLDVGIQYKILKEKYFLHPSQYITIDKTIANPVDKNLYIDNINLIKDMGYEIEEKENLYYLRFSHDIAI